LRGKLEYEKQEKNIRKEPRKKKIQKEDKKKRKEEFKEELTDCTRNKERFTSLPEQREESLWMRQAPALGSGTSSSHPGTSSTPTRSSTTSTASGRTRTPLKGGRTADMRIVGGMGGNTGK
jgi:hypothetical protein